MSLQPPDGAQAVRRSIELLRLVATGQEQGVRLTDLVSMSGLTRPTAHRLLKALIDESAVEQDPQSRRYRIGTEMLLLGLARRSGFPIRGAAEPFLLALALELGDTVFLTVRHGADSVCIGRQLGTHPIQVLSIEVGARRPLGASVSGLVLLAGVPPEQAAALTQFNRRRLELLGLPVETVLGRAQQARDNGHAYAEAGIMSGTRALALPIRDPQGDVVAAVSVAALAERLDRRGLPDAIARMRHCVAGIESRLQALDRARTRAPARA